MKENMQRVEINQNGDAQREASRNRLAAYVEQVKAKRKGEGK